MQRSPFSQAGSAPPPLDVVLEPPPPLLVVTVVVVVAPPPPPAPVWKPSPQARTPIAAAASAQSAKKETHRMIASYRTTPAHPSHRRFDWGERAR
jgi:hypothetical protein